MFQGVLVGIIGFLLVVFVENNVIATEIVIFITFLTNLCLIYDEKFLRLKSRIRNILAAFVFGALLGAIIT